ncbi:MAG TPA: hypothetical protein VF384_12290 [Planctomycetota bacterium]
MSEPMSVCENCGIKFEMPEVVTSSKILCAKCAAERRAKAKAAKTTATAVQPARSAPASPAVGVARPGTAARAPASSRPAMEAPRAAEAPRRAPAAPHHEVDPRKVREADAKRMARIGWMVVGGLTLVTGIVLLFVMNTHGTREAQEKAYQDSLQAFLTNILSADLESEESIRQKKDMIAKPPVPWRGSKIQEQVSQHLLKLNRSLEILIKTRGVKEKLKNIEDHLAGSPTLDVLEKDFAAVRDAELSSQAADAGDVIKSRYEAAAKQVSSRYLEMLRKAAEGASTATTGEGLAPYGALEDTVRILLHEAMASKDKAAEDLYGPMWRQTYTEVNGIVSRMFNEAYLNRVPWTPNLLTDAANWAVVDSSSFSHTFGAGLTLTNEAGDQAASGGLSYTPGNNWRDYVLEIEFKVDSGTLVFYTRIGDKMDTKEVPGFSVGVTKDPTITIEYGKTYNIVVSTIGNQISVSGEGIAWSDDNIRSTKSRKGEPGIVAQEGTKATITKFRARHLR